METGIVFSPEEGESIESRNQRIRAQLAADMLPVLPFERQVIADQIAQIMEEQNAMGRELGEVNHQGSETWHDNFAANNIQRNSVVVSVRGSRLAETERGAVEFDYPPEGPGATIGSLVEVVFGDSGVVSKTFLTGFVRESEPSVPFELPEGTTFVTLKSPLGSALIGARPGDVITYQANKRTLNVRVVSTTQLRPMEQPS